MRLDDKEEKKYCTWHNGRGIGGIAKKEYRKEYTLDFIGNANICRSKIIFTIPCEK